jgi:hypothetical protein
VLGAALVAAMFAFNGDARRAPAADDSARPTSAANVAAPGADQREIDRLQSSFDALSARVTELAGQVQELRGSADRTAVAVPTEPTPAGEELATLSPKAKSEVLGVLNEEFQRQEAERQAQRLARDKVQAQRRAERVAKDLSLGAADTQKLGDFYVAAGQKRRELFSSMQDGDFDRDTMMQSMQDMRTWQKDELTKQFGAALADQLEAYERPNWGGPGGGRGGRQFAGLGYAGGNAKPAVPPPAKQP